MTPLDEAPEQRWRRTVDRRSRPAKLKVDRLLRDFGYAELDAAVGDAIEARLAGVALAVTPSLRDAAAGEVVTIYADEGAVERVAPSPVPEAPPARAPEPRPKPKPRAKAAPSPEPVATDIAQMVTYLKQEVLDARSESERLRTELDGRIAARTDAQTDAQAIIAEQAAALQEQSRQIAELGAALDHTRQALAETREEIRRAVGELQALPEPELFPEAVDDDEPLDELELGAELPYGDPDAAEDREDAWPPLIAVPDEPATGEGEPAAEGEAPPIADAGLVVEEPALGVGDAAAEFEEPAPSAAETALEHDEPRTEFDAPAPDLDEPPLQADPSGGETWVPAQLREPEAETDAPSRQDPGETEPPAAEPEPGGHEPFAELDAAQSGADELTPAAADGPVDEGEPPIDDEVVADFDDFLYDPDELYDPESPGAGDAMLDTPPERDTAWLDQPTSALPPPPPAPPSPWADEPAGEPEAPAAHDRPTRSKVLRGRGGRGRGRWQGTCSICGRLPADNKRKDLQAAGWDLDDEAAACPQCRGIG